MGSPVSKELSKKNESEEAQEKKINIQILNEKLQQTKIETETKAKQAKIEIELKEIEKETKANQAKIDKENNEIASWQYKFFNSLFLTGFVTLSADYLIRGTRFGRKNCIKLHLNLTPSRFINALKKKESIIMDKTRVDNINRCALMTLPTVIIGPTGCGKSTLLNQIINHVKCTQKRCFFFPRLTAFVSLRQIDSETQQSSSSSERQKAANIQEAATNLFVSIGYPVNSSILCSIIDSVKSIRIKSENFRIDLNPDLVAKNRMKEALGLLFECLSDARGFVAFDEVHDLIRNDRLAESGGREIFHYLAFLFVIHIVNSQRVQGVCAGSSNHLLSELNETLVHGTRLCHLYIQDFDKSEVLSYLENTLHIPADVATFIIDKCGTRLRLLQSFTGISNLAQAQTVTATLDISARQIVEKFYAFSEKYPELLVTMNSIVNGESVYFKNLPKDVQLIDYIGRVLYVGPGSQLFFQDAVIERAWKKIVETSK